MIINNFVHPTYLALPLAMQEHPSAVRSKESHQASHICRVRSQHTENNNYKICIFVYQKIINEQEKSKENIDIKLCSDKKL